METKIELEILAGPVPGEYVVRVLDAAGGGESEGRLRIEVDAMLAGRSGLERAVLASAVRARHRVSDAERPLRETGQQLFDALFGGAVQGVYRASLAVARERGEKLRVVLRLAAPELSLLPWEALYDPELGGYLCRREPLVRHIPAPHTPVPLRIQLPLRILGLVAAPRGEAELDVEAEQRNLERALAEPIADGRVQLRWITQATWDSVQYELINGSWHVLHYLGHGDYDPYADEGRLALVGSDGRANWVEASLLVDLLSQATPTPPLIVLNCCASAQGGEHDRFSGIAATLVRSGVNAVAAMQFSVSDHAAIAFPKGFYAALAAGKGVDEALRSGRITILGIGSLEWVTPVLYLRGSATRLFELEQAPPRPPYTSDPRWRQASDAYGAGRWDEAVELLEALQRRYGSSHDLQSRLNEARRQQDLQSWEQEATRAVQARDWPRALACLGRIAAIDPAYANVAQRLEQTRAAQRADALRAEVVSSFEAEDWQAVVPAAEELLRLEPGSTDIERMLTRARRQLEEAALTTRYRQAVLHLDGRRWLPAIELFTAIEQERPGYLDVVELLKRAKAGHRREEEDGNTSTSEPWEPEPRTIQVGQWVFCIAISPDGTRLATGSRKHVRVFDLKTGEELWKGNLGAWVNCVLAVVFSGDGSRAAAGSDSNTACVWNASTGATLITVAHKNPVTAVALSRDGTRLATGSADKTARVWDVATGTALCTVAHDGGVRAVALTPLASVVSSKGLQGRRGDVTCLVTSSDDKTACVWDVDTGVTLATITHKGGANGMAFSSGGTRLAMVGSVNNKKVRVWDVATGKLLRAVTHEGRVTGLALSPDGVRLATGGADRKAVMWDIRTGTRLLTVSHTDWVRGVAFSPGATRLVTASDDKTVRIWDVTAAADP